MKIISIHDIIACNKMLAEKSLPYKVHLRDACGAQSCWIEALEEGYPEKKISEVGQVLKGFFLRTGVHPEFSEDGYNFWIR